MRVRKLLHSCATIEAEPFRRKLSGRDPTWGPVCLAVADLVNLSADGRAGASNADKDDFACLPKPRKFGARGVGRGRAAGGRGSAGHDDARGPVPARLASGGRGASGNGPDPAAELRALASTHFDDADPGNPEAESSSSSACSSESDEATPPAPPVATEPEPLPALHGFDALLAKHGIEDEGGELFIGVAPFRTHLGRIEFLNSRCCYA